VERPSGLIEREWGEAQVLEVRFTEFHNESRECFVRSNIFYQSKSLLDITIILSFKKF
jgi:hypothetical protein